MISNIRDFKLTLHIYENHCPVQMVLDSVYNVVAIEATGVQLQYMQQPLLRFMDFLIE